MRCSRADPADCHPQDCRLRTEPPPDHGMWLTETAFLTAMRLVGWRTSTPGRGPAPGISAQSLHPSRSRGPAVCTVQGKWHGCGHDQNSGGQFDVTLITDDYAKLVFGLLGDEHPPSQPGYVSRQVSDTAESQDFPGP